MFLVATRVPAVAAWDVVSASVALASNNTNAAAAAADWWQPSSDGEIVVVVVDILVWTLCLSFQRSRLFADWVPSIMEFTR